MNKDSVLYKYINEIKPFIDEIFKNEYSGHDISHLERTLKIALHIQEKEGGDRIIIGISAYLHDIHRIMQNENGKYVTPKESLDTIKKILAHTNLSEEQIDKICYCVEYHEEYNWNGFKTNDINTLILQDADNLDAIGAIGIARTFSYCGFNGIDMYNDKIPIKEKKNFKETSTDISAIHHFYNKLLKLGDNMNTTSAKNIAQNRIEFTKEFIKRFLKEWDEFN